MSKYIDGLIENGFTLEELYKKGLIDEVEKKSDNEEVKSEEVKEVEIKEGENTDGTGKETENQESNFVSKEDFNSFANDIKEILTGLKKTMQSENIKNIGVDELKDNDQITLEQAFNGLAFGN